VTHVRAVAECYFDDVVSIEPFGGGHINETVLVQTATDDYVVQRINRSVFEDAEAVMANILAVHRHLKGRLVPEPVADRAGEWLVYEGGEPWRAWRRVPAASPADGVTPSIAASAGRLLGHFHVALHDLDPTTVTTTLPGFHGLDRRVRDLRAAVDADPVGRAATVEAEIAMAFAAVPLVERAAAVTRRVPVRVAHHDAKLDNMLFRDGEAVCLLDLDTLMPGAWFWDVGDLLRTASTITAEDDVSGDGPVVDPTLYAAVLDGYRAAVGTVAAPAEIDAIEVAGAVVAYEQAVRFLTDWLEGDVYYRISRPEQNRDRALAQFRLLASMPGTVTAP
jgi:Ser/Thr protein kinase RdoA (MazF antagonist)